MMTNLCCEVLRALRGKTLCTAESCTGGGIGSALTAVPGSSEVFRGGIISYCNDLKNELLGVREETLDRYGAVSAQTAEEMARGAAEIMRADVAVSVTGLAGPDGDAFGNPVGTVYVGYWDKRGVCHEKFLFSGDRESVRTQAITAALKLILRKNQN